MKQNLITTRVRIEHQEWFIVAQDRTGRLIKEPIVVPHTPVSFDSDVVWRGHVHGFELFCRVFGLHGRVRYAQQESTVYAWLWDDNTGHILVEPDPIDPIRLKWIRPGQEK